MVGEFIISCGSTVYWYRSWGLIWLGEEREKANLYSSKGCKGILKKQSCPGCNAPIGFTDALTFLRSVRRRHLLDFFFFFMTKIGEFQGEQDSSICFNSSCASISSLAACNFSFVRGHCSVQIGSSFFQVILIIVLFVKWAVAPRENVGCISQYVISYIFLLKAYISLFLSNYEVSCILAFYRLVNIFIFIYINILYIIKYIY